MTTCFYVADPMCSWCWAFAPILDEARAILPETVDLRYVLGGLARDSAEPMPLGMQEKIQQTWRVIADRTGTTFNFDFWTEQKPRRSTYPACRAVLAAREQDARKMTEMFSAIQRAYYLEARNPSDHETLIDLASELGLDQSRFSENLVSPEIETLLQADFAERRRLNAGSFPSLIVERDGQPRWVAEGYAPATEVLPRLEVALG